jgi:hypothetical protein
MRLSRLRIRVLTLLVVVAMVALSLGAWRFWQRDQGYLDWAETCTALRQIYLDIANEADSSAVQIEAEASWNLEKKDLLSRSAARLRRSASDCLMEAERLNQDILFYRRLAFRPWRRFEPSPQGPLNVAKPYHAQMRMPHAR